MPSSDETQSSLDVNISNSSNKNRIAFVNALKENNILLNRSLSAKIVLKKDKAWSNVRISCEKSVGKTTFIDQLKKMLNNMKTEIKKKTDRNQPGIRPIKLHSWGKDFFKL